MKLDSKQFCPKKILTSAPFGSFGSYQVSLNTTGLFNSKHYGTITQFYTFGHWMSQLWSFCILFLTWSNWVFTENIRVKWYRTNIFKTFYSKKNYFSYFSWVLLLPKSWNPFRTGLVWNLNRSILFNPLALGKTWCERLFGHLWKWRSIE